MLPIREIISEDQPGGKMIDRMLKDRNSVRADRNSTACGALRVEVRAYQIVSPAYTVRSGVAFLIHNLRFICFDPEFIGERITNPTASLELDPLFSVKTQGIPLIHR
ncbi:hypothetical protein D3C75_826300 [compost metagenome]